MNNGSIKIYALAVCFVTLVCGAITAGFIVFNAIKIVAPTLTINPAQLNGHGNNMVFRASAINMGSSGPPVSAFVGPQGLPPTMLGAPDFIHPGARPVPQLSDEALAQLKQERQASVISGHVFRAKQGLILQAIIISICCILYLWHWKLAARVRGV